jgi:hypothetical protein
MDRLKKFRNSGLILLLGGMLMSVPAFAQIDLSGGYRPNGAEDATGNPDIGDFLGVPINDAGRLRAESYDASILDMREWQCRPHPSDYMSRGPSTLRIAKNVDPVTRQVTSWEFEWFRSNGIRNVWMDGRPHPPEGAQHTWQGFSTGEWHGNILTIHTTHIKEGYVRRNGLPRSDKAKLTEHVIRHGGNLTWVSIVEDPVYMTEPYVRVSNYIEDPRQNMTVYPCDPRPVLDLPLSFVPHHLPGQNPYLQEFPNRYEIPADATRGGAETMYPDFITRMKSKASN